MEFRRETGPAHVRHGREISAVLRFFRTVFILILKVRCEFFLSFTIPFSFRTPAIMKLWK